MTNGSAIALRLIPKLVQAHNSLDSSVSPMWVSFFNFSHDKTRTPNLMVFREISFWNGMFLQFNKNGNVYCCWIVIDSPHVRKSRELHAVQRRQQETTRQFCKTLNIALSAICFSNAAKWVEVWLLTSKPCLFSSNIFFSSSTSFKQRPQAEFHGQKCWK